MSKAQVFITETTLRDAHQSLWATRMRTEDMLPILPLMDTVGFWSVEMWGGATFDVMLRYLHEDPWERLKKIKELMPNTKLQMLLRGQNLVGYRHYPDDIVKRFIKKAHENGIDVFRIFDALNDTRNVKVAIEAAKDVGAHAEGTVVYTISPIHTIDNYIETAKQMVDMGADTICIKDMAGILKPQVTVELVSALKKAVSVPIHLHCHFIGGMALMNYVEGIRVGASKVDTASFPLSMGSSQPATEVLVAALKETKEDPNLDLEKLYLIAEYFDDVRKKHGYDPGQTSLVHMKIYSHQIPGGMISNLYSQLEEQKALDKLPEALEEVPRVREEVGYPPLVTPMSQMVGTQAVLNVLAGKRWTVVSQEMKDYLKGLYGKPPGEISEEIRKKVVKDDEEIVHVRPADLIKKTFEDYKKEIKDLAQSEEDVLTYAMFPKEAIDFFERKRKSMDKMYKSQGIEVSSDMEFDEIKSLIDQISGKDIAEVIYEKDGLKLTIRKQIGTVVSESEAPAVTTVKEDKKKVIEEKIRQDGWKEVKAPMVGTFYSSPSPDSPPYVEINSTVSAGDVLCLIEAMKLFNEVTAEEPMVIKEVCIESGSPVEYGQVLFYYEPIERQL